MIADLTDMGHESTPVANRARGRNLAELCATIDVTDSAEPAVVFTDVAAAGVVIGLCDHCTIWIVEAGQPGYRIERSIARLGVPGEPTARPVVESAAVSLASLPIDGYSEFAGEMTLDWEHAPGADAYALTRLLADRAVSAIHTARLTGLVAAEQQRIANLQAALDSNRDIGAAIGILMTRYAVTQPDAFALLREASQNSHRKLHQIAAEVLYEGDLPRSIGKPLIDKPLIEG